MLITQKFEGPDRAANRPRIVTNRYATGPKHYSKRCSPSATDSELTEWLIAHVRDDITVHGPDEATEDRVWKLKDADGRIVHFLRVTELALDGERWWTRTIRAKFREGPCGPQNHQSDLAYPVGSLISCPA